MAKTRAKTANQGKPDETVKPTPPKRVIVGDKEVARHYGKSTRTIQTWRDEGMPHREIEPRRYEYDLDETDRWVDDNHGSDDFGDGNPVRAERERVKLAIEKEQLEKIRRENAEAAGNILPRDEYELHLVERNQRVRDELVNIPQQMRKHLGNNASKALAELKKLIEKALNHLAETSVEK